MIRINSEIPDKKNDTKTPVFNKYNIKVSWV